MTSYHFQRRPVPAELEAGVARLSTFPGDFLKSFVDRLLEILGGEHGSEPLSVLLLPLAEEREVNVKQLTAIASHVLTVFQGALKSNLSAKQVQEDFQQCGLAVDKAQVVAQCWEASLPRLRVAHQQNASTAAAAQLRDAEWKLGLTVGSSETKSPPSTAVHVQLLLHLDDGRRVPLEMDLPMYMSLMAQLEKIKVALAEL